MVAVRGNLFAGPACNASVGTSPAMQLPADRELDELTLRRAQRGEAAACRALVERYERPVFALVGRMLGRRDGVEDLAQETFLRAFRALADFDPRGPARLSTWLLTIATRLCLDALRRRAHEPLPLEAARTLDSGARTDAAAERRALGRAIELAVSRLPPDQRAVVVLREWHELDYDEIARALELDLGTVKSRLSRARAALR